MAAQLGALAHDAPTTVANLRWNMGVNVIDGVFTAVGNSLVSVATILPMLVSQLTPDKFAVGMLPALHALSFQLPQLFTANLAQRLQKRKRFIILGGIGMRLPMLAIALALWLLAERSPGLALAFVLSLLAVSGLTVGLVIPAYFDLIARVIPVRTRGIFQGLRNGLGALMGVGGGLMAAWVLTAQPYPRNYALLFALSAVLQLVGLVGFGLTREPESGPRPLRQSQSDYLRALPALLKREANFSRFLLARLVGIFGTMASGFFVVYGAERFGLGGREAGLLTSTMVATQAVANPLWGLLGDRVGHKAVIMGSTAALGAAALAAQVANSPWWIYAVIALLGASIAGEFVGGMSILMEFGAPEQRPTYIGLGNSLLALPRVIAPLIGAALATAWGYPSMFMVSWLVSLVAVAMLAWGVREPRHAVHGEH